MDSFIKNKFANRDMADSVKISFPNGGTRSLSDLVDRSLRRAEEIGKPVSVLGGHTMDCEALDLEVGTDCQTCEYSNVWNEGRCELGLPQNGSYSISLSLEKAGTYCESYKQQEGKDCTCGAQPFLRVIE